MAAYQHKSREARAQWFGETSTRRASFVVRGQFACPRQRAGLGLELRSGVLLPRLAIAFGSQATGGLGLPLFEGNVGLEFHFE